jgi:hypothetical protein
MKSATLTRSSIVVQLCVIVGLLAYFAVPAHAGQQTDYTDPKQLLSVPFGCWSPWAQPWRATMITVPTYVFVNGIGVNYDGRGNPDIEIRHLALHGVKRIRLEIGWGNLDFATQSQLLNSTRMTSILTACRRYAIRPLILLNANDGGPCPMLTFSHKVVLDAGVGATTVTLDNTSGVIPGYSGFSYLTTSCAAQVIVTGIYGNTVTLSDPLPKSLAAGTTVRMATLKFKPFSAPGTQSNEDTISGWKNYVDVVSHFVYGCMNGNVTTPVSDAGFDLEVWNELTFGSQFLSINNYYIPALDTFKNSDIWSEITSATAQVAAANPSIFANVGISDGFANTVPWPAASLEPQGITAISKHPYQGRTTFPVEKPKNNLLNALFQPDPSSWQPDYTELFPEYSGSLIQTETSMRDISSLSTTIYTVVHGTMSRPTPGSSTVTPVPVWITETGIAPNSDDPNIDRTSAMYVKAKIDLRYYTFYLGAGAGLVTLYNDISGDTGLGLVSDAFLSYASQPGATYPDDDATLTSPALNAIGNLSGVMRQHLDTRVGSDAEPVRKIELMSISDEADNKQFLGDGTAGHPPLYDRDVFAFFPTQVNSHRFVIPYYVITRDVLHIYNSQRVGGHQYDMPVEKFTLLIRGISPHGMSIKCYDPILNTYSKITGVTRVGNSAFRVNVSAEDYPRLLVIQEATHRNSAQTYNL